MPPTTSITNRHLKSVASPFLSIGYCEVLNGQPAPLNGSILGVNTHRPAPPALNQSNTSDIGSTISSSCSSSNDSQRSVAFLYGGIFDAQSVTIEKPPLPPHMQRIVDRVVARGGLAGDIDSYDAMMGSEKEGKTDKDDAGPPPPPAWRCARDTAARMDAYLANHRPDTSSQQLWVRELNARARGATAANTSATTMDTHTTSVIDSAHYRDLMTVQLETKRRHTSVASAQDRSRAHAAGAQLERQRAAAIRERERVRLAAMARRSIDNNPSSDNSSAQSATSSHITDPSSPSSPSLSPSAASATCTATPIAPSPLSPEEALQYLSLADREYLLSVRNSFLHCDRVLRDSQQQLAALRKGFEGGGVQGAKSNSSSEKEGEKEKDECDLANKCLKLAEAATWAKGHLRSITSDGSSALWFTAVPTSLMPDEELTHGTDQRLSAKGKSINSNRPLAVAQADELPSAACPILQAQEGQTQQEKRKGRSSSPVKLSLFSTGNSRAVRVRPELIAAYLVANGVDLDAFAAYLEKELTTTAAAKSDMLNKIQTAKPLPSASDRIPHCVHAPVGDDAASANTKEERRFTDLNTTKDLCPWRWSAFEAQRAAKALKRRAKANSACPSELSHHQSKAFNDSSKGATPPIAMTTEQADDTHIAKSRGLGVLPNDLFGSSCAQAVDLRTHLRYDCEEDHLHHLHHDGVGGDGRGTCISDSNSLIPDWDFAKTIAGRGSLISFAQGYRSRNIKGLCADHTAENTTERRRCNLAAQGRSYNSVKEVASCAISDNNVVVSDNFDAGLYLANSRKAVDVLPAQPQHLINANKTTSSSASFKIDVPVLTLQPPSLVTRALGLIRYKLNPSLGPHEQVIVPVPDVELGSSSSSAAGGTTEMELEHGEVVILCSRSVFESEATDNFTFAADGATIDDVVEAVLQGILLQVARNIEACTRIVQKASTRKDGQFERVSENIHSNDCVANSKDVENEIRRALEYVTAVDVKALASDVCSVGLDCGTKKTLQAMVAVVPPRSDEQTMLSAASSSRRHSSLDFSTTPPDPLTSGFLVSEVQVTHNTRITTSFLPSPLSVGHLKVDPLFRAAFCEDIQRSGLSLIDFVKMRFKLLSRALLASSSSSTTSFGHRIPFVYSVSNVGAAEWKSANHLLNSCFPAVGAEMRRALRSEAVLFGDGPPQFSTKGDLATGSYEQKVDTYYRSIAREIFGRHRVNKE